MDSAKILRLEPTPRRWVFARLKQSQGSLQRRHEAAPLNPGIGLASPTSRTDLKSLPRGFAASMQEQRRAQYPCYRLYQDKRLADSSSTVPSVDRDSGRRYGTTWRCSFLLPNYCALVVELTEFPLSNRDRWRLEDTQPRWLHWPLRRRLSGEISWPSGKPPARCIVLTAYGLDCSVRICLGKCVRFFNRIVFQKGRY